MNANHNTDVLKVTVKVKPKSSKRKIILCEDGSLKVSLLSPPEDGKANDELLQYLSDSLGISKASIKINRGSLRSKTKILEFSNITRGAFNNLIALIVSS